MTLIVFFVKLEGENKTVEKEISVMKYFAKLVVLLSRLGNSQYK